MSAILAAFVAGDFLLQHCGRLPGHEALIAMSLLSLGLIGACLRLGRRHKTPARALAGAAAAMLGFIYASSQAELSLSDELEGEIEGRPLQLLGIVANLPVQGEHGIRFAFDVEQVLSAGMHVPRRVGLSWYDPARMPRPAEEWRFEVRLRRPHGTYNPAGFDSELWMLEQGLRANGYVSSAAGAQPPVRLRTIVWQFNALVDRMRDDLRARLQSALGARRYAGVIVALVMGDQAMIAPADWTLFNRTGISHLVSISGLHITMIAALVALAAGIVWKRAPWLQARFCLQAARAFAGTAGALAYCLLAGWGVPAQRTFVMLATVAAALSLRLRMSAFAILASAAGLVCLWDPWAVTAPGFWLSFGAVASIFLALGGRPPGEGTEHVRGKAMPVPAQAGLLRAHGPRVLAALGEAARVQLAVTLGLVPLTLALFQQISPISPFANAIAIPLVSYLVTPLALLGAAAAALGGPFEFAATGLLGASHALFALLADVLQWMVRLPYAWIAFPTPPAWAIASAILGAAWSLAPAGWPLRWAGLTWMLPALVWPAERPGPGALWLTALDVGQGMALVLETATDTIVFDTGPRLAEDVDAGSRVIVPYLRSRGIDRVSLLVVSHLDSDHSGGARAVIQSMRIGRVLTSIPGDNELMQGAGPVQRCERGQQLAIGELRVSVLSPDAALYAQPRASTNARSCVLRFELGRASVLLTGDVPARQEAGIVSAYGQGLASQVMVAPHHGSRSSSSEAFIHAVRPTWVSIQVCYRSRFGHPHPQVLQRYRAAGAAVVRSDWVGAARWRLAADASVSVERWRIDHARYWLDQPMLRALPPAGSDGEESGPPSE